MTKLVLALFAFLGVVGGVAEARLHRSCKKLPVMAERVETELEVVAVLKGATLDVQGKASTKIVLHHYREAPRAVSINGPGLVAFDPKATTQFLMFLVRDKDGQYVAVSGQTDPNYSVEPLKMQKI